MHLTTGVGPISTGVFNMYYYVNLLIFLKSKNFWILNHICSKDVGSKNCCPKWEISIYRFLSILTVLFKKVCYLFLIKLYFNLKNTVSTMLQWKQNKTKQNLKKKYDLGGKKTLKIKSKDL